jgi:AcrR family transcriptional regulator
VAARDQLLDAAGRLFYASGIAATGVDTVVREAGVSKPTLYAHFRSKDELVAAVLAARHAERAAELEAWVAREGGPRERVLSVFTYLERFYARDGARGCAFLNAAAEGAGLPEATAEKAWLLELLERLAAEAGAPEPARTASQLLLLVDGVSGRVVVGGPETAASAIADATAAARALLP